MISFNCFLKRFFFLVSGQAPEEPVVSTKSGLVFEKRLVLQAIAANGGKCPITEEPLAPEDLVPIKGIVFCVL